MSAGALDRRPGRSLAAGVCLVFGVALLVLVPGAPRAGAFPSTNGVIVFESDRTGDAELFTTSATGGNATNRTDSPGSEDLDPAVSPDGSTIAFARKASPKARAELFTMKVDGGGRRRLTNTKTLSELQPAWSPDGTHIAYVRRTRPAGDFRIYIMSADGTGQTRLSLGPVGSTDAGPAWSPDGTRIVFTSDRDGGFPQLYVMDADGKHRNRLLFDDAAIAAHPDWSPDGTR